MQWKLYRNSCTYKSNANFSYIWRTNTKNPSTYQVDDILAEHPTGHPINTPCTESFKKIGFTPFKSVIKSKSDDIIFDCLIIDCIEQFLYNRKQHYRKMKLLHNIKR